MANIIEKDIKAFFKTRKEEMLAIRRNQHKSADFRGWNNQTKSNDHLTGLLVLAK